MDSKQPIRIVIKGATGNGMSYAALRLAKQLADLKCEGCGCLKSVCSSYEHPVVACCPDCNHNGCWTDD